MLLLHIYKKISKLTKVTKIGMKTKLRISCMTTPIFQIEAMNIQTNSRENQWLVTNTKFHSFSKYNYIFSCLVTL